MATQSQMTPDTDHADPYADPINPAPPKVDMNLDLGRAAFVMTDPQIDLLSPKGVGWGRVR
jgi:biuret amidohydrolase